MSASPFKIGVSGHRERPNADWSFVRRAVHDILVSRGAQEAWSCLAIGADTIFAEEAIDYGIALMAVIPNPDEYRREFSGTDAGVYDRLLTRAHRVETVCGAREQAFRLAGERIVDAVDMMVFIWDGAPAVSEGGTADIVDYAARAERASIRIDPIRRTCSTMVSAKGSAIRDSVHATLA